MFALLRVLTVAVTLYGAFATSVIFAQTGVVQTPANRGQADQDRDVRAGRIMAEADQDRTPLVLPLTYFQKQAALQRAGAAPGGAIDLFAGNQVVVADKVATALLNISKLQLGNPGLYLTEWQKTKPMLIAEIGRIPSVTPTTTEAWRQFLQSWEDDVLAGFAGQFQVAARQAAYSIIRLSQGKEEEQIEKVKNDLINANAGGMQSMSGGASDSGVRYSHQLIIHERLMNSIYRHHDRHVARYGRVVGRR